MMIHGTTDHSTIPVCYQQFLANVNSGSRELRFTLAICYIARPFVVCLSSVTFVRPTQAVEIFGNISTALGTFAIRWHPLKILRRSSKGNPSDGGVKHNSWQDFNRLKVSCGPSV